MAERLPASFRGVSFYVDISDVTAGRRTVTHEYPQRDEPFTEDLGRAAREFHISGYVIGDDCIEQAKKLRDALEKPGAATLVHPELGELQVVALPGASMSFSQSKRMVRFSLSFVEAGLNAFPTQESATQSISRGAADGLISSAIDAFAETINLDSVEDFVQDALNGDLLDSLGIISNAEISKVLGFSDRVSDLAVDAIGLVRGGPAAFATKLMGAVGLSGLATTVAGWQRVGKSLCALVDDLSGEREEPSYGTVKPESDVIIESNRRAVYSLCRQAILAQTVGVSSLIGTNVDSTVASDLILPGGETSATSSASVSVMEDSSSKTNYDSVSYAQSSSSVEDDEEDASSSAPTISYDEMMEAQEMIVDALEEEMLDAESDDVFMALRTAATAVSRDLTERSQSQARLYDYDAGSVMPSCVTAMELYGDAGRAKEIVVRNSVRHPLFCPNVLKVLNE